MVEIRRKRIPFSSPKGFSTHSFLSNHKGGKEWVQTQEGDESLGGAEAEEG